MTGLEFIEADAVDNSRHRPKYQNPDCGIVMGRVLAHCRVFPSRRVYVVSIILEVDRMSRGYPSTITCKAHTLTVVLNPACSCPFRRPRTALVEFS